jgi:phosphoadenosine phosphosulfate reductase
VALAKAWRGLDLLERLAALRSHISGRIVFTTSFGLEDQAIAHAIFAQNLAVEVVTLDTGRLFPETHEVWAETEARYGARIRVYAPGPDSLEALITRDGINGFRSSVAARLDCCAVRKVAPLNRALSGCAAWITGIRADQSAERAGLGLVSFDNQRRLIKANPLFDWTREETFAFVRARRSLQPAARSRLSFDRLRAMHARCRLGRIGACRALVVGASRKEGMRSAPVTQSPRRIGERLQVERGC